MQPSLPRHYALAPNIVEESDRQTSIIRSVYVQIDRQTDRQTDMRKYRWADTDQKEKQTDRQNDSQTDRQTDGGRDEKTGCRVNIECE